MNYSTLTHVMNGLMSRYQERVPDVNNVLTILKKNNVITKDSDIENDHIAFRTLGVSHLGIQSLEKIFLHLGYKKMEYFYFEEKKLNAYWYHPPQENFPRIFISELRVSDLSKQAQEIIHRYTSAITNDPVLALNLNDGKEIDTFLHTSLWKTPLWTDYEMLLKESEYAAWTIYNKYYLNHYTVSVHNLRAYNTLKEFNELLEKNGIHLNDAGGKIKISGDTLLLQSSSVAVMVDADFSDGSKHKISGSYVEFAERRVLPQFAHLKKNEIKREHRRDGFETKNADKIFESTFTTQTNKT